MCEHPMTPENTRVLHTGRDGLVRRCRACALEAQSRYHAKTRAARAALIREARARGCADCGAPATDLDHVPERGPVLFRLGSNRTRPLRAVVEEISKCDPVCRPCHRARTKERALCAR